MHDGEQITAIKNGKLARSRKQHSLTDSECTGLKKCTALKWSTNKLNMYRRWRWFFCLYRMFLPENGESKSKSFHWSTLLDDCNLNDFKSISTVPPMWSKLKKLWPFMTLLWPTMSPSVNSGAIKIDWKIDMCGKESFRFLCPSRFSRFEERKKSIYKLLMIFTCTTKLSWKSFRQSQRWLKKYFCWATKPPSLKFFMSYVLQFCDSIASYGETWDVVSLGWDLTKICVLINCITFENNF